MKCQYCNILLVNSKCPGCKVTFVPSFNVAEHPNDKIIYTKSDHPKTFRIWMGMKDRCNNPKSPKYKYYGGRGIKVCERWQNSFTNFIIDMGPRPENLSINRIDNDGNYEPSNCEWANAVMQANNK